MSRVLRWWWIRHAPTRGAADGAAGLVGWTDAEADLSDTAALLRLRGALPEAANVISSGLLRAEATAVRIAGKRNRGPAERGLREQFFGRWEGLTHDQIAADDPEAAASFVDEPAAWKPPGGESFAHVCARVAATVERLAGTVREGDLVVVAHAGTIRAALAQALEAPPAAALAFEIAPLSLTRIDRIETGDRSGGPPAWRIGCVNRMV